MMNKDVAEVPTNGGDDDDFLALTLYPALRTAPAPPQTPPTPPPQSQQLNPYLASMYGLFLDQTPPPPVAAPSFHPYPRPHPRNPNHLMDLGFVPDFGTMFQQVLNPFPLLLNPNPNPNPTPNPSPSPSPSPRAVYPEAGVGAARRRRSSANRGLRAGKSQTVEAKYPWATNRRAGVESLERLREKGVEIVTGEVQCRRCEKQFEVGYDLQLEFSKLRSFIEENKEKLKHRSAAEWDNPACVDCKMCHEKGTAKAVVGLKKKEINWLFLLLGGFLCCCTLEQLKYFCKHTGNHRTGAKNRVLYLTYLGLCKQLDPSGPFDALSS